jgi:cell division protein FtsL
MPNVAARRVFLPPGSARRPVPRWVGPLTAGAVLLVVVAAFGGAYWDAYRLRREEAELTRQLEELHRQNTRLREEIRLLHTPEYIERLAREQLGLVKPGELAVIVVQPAPVPAPTATPKSRAPANSWWSRWLDR